MNDIDYRAMLYEKMKNEQNSYRKWLLSQQPEEILNHTYEYTTREDILMCMEELSLQPKQAKAIQQIGTERESEESLEKIRIEQLKVWLKTVRDPADIKQQLLQMDKGQRDLLDILSRE